MVNGFEGFVCKQKSRGKKCLNCEHLRICMSYEDLKEKREIEKIEEEKRRHKCFNCIWGNKENMYCPFMHCMKDKI